MKTFITIISLSVFFCIPTYVSAQITPIERSTEENRINRLTIAFTTQAFLYEIVREGEDPFYRIRFKDFRYPNIEAWDYFIIDNKQSLLDLRDLVLNALNEDRDYTVSFEMAGEVLTVARIGSRVMIMVGDGPRTNGYSERHWNRLFEGIDDL